MKEQYEKAKHVVPMSPFEDRRFTMSVFAATAFLSIFVLEYSQSMHKPEMTFFAVCVLLAGCLFDQASTELALSLYSEHPELVETGIIEQNVLLPDVPSIEELYKSRVTAADALLFILTPLYPPIGICFGVYKVSAGINNIVIEKRLRATLALAQQEESMEIED